MKFDSTHKSIVELLATRHGLTEKEITSIVKAFWSNGQHSLFTTCIESWTHVKLKHLGVLKPAGVKAYYLKKRLAESVTIRNKIKLRKKRSKNKLTNSSNDIIFDGLIKYLKPTKR